MIIVLLAHKKAKWRQHLNYILALDWNIWVDLCNLLSLTTIGRNQTHQPLEDWIWNCLSSLFILLWPTSWSSCDSTDGQKNKTMLQTVHHNFTESSSLHSNLKWSWVCRVPKKGPVFSNRVTLKMKHILLCPASAELFHANMYWSGRAGALSEWSCF